MDVGLTQHLAALWESGDAPPDVFSLLALHGGLSAEQTLALVLTDQRYRWNSDQPLTVEDYLNRLPELATQTEAKLQLIVGEFASRASGGAPPRIDEFAERFAELGEMLQSALAQASNEKGSAEFLATEAHSSSANAAIDGSAITQSHAAAAIGEAAHIGRYQLERLLGEGAFGRVWLAYDDQLRRSVAIKVPKPEHFARAEDAESYLAEARTVAGLDHPHIVPVFDVGRTDNGAIYVVSKYIDGCHLAELISKSRPSFDAATELLCTIALALQHAHERRLVHRDIKPANILIERQSQTPYLADFGLAISEGDRALPGSVAGTPAYMSPEQARGESHRIDGRSDLFSLGIVFYELLTGHRPFRAITWEELAHQIISIDPVPPRELDETVPTELERICLKALSKRASDRYATAAELADDLRSWRQGAQQQAADRKIVPRGLRSFSADDADFFLELLPGPRDRTGLPESLRFWKSRLEQTDSDKTFSVGLLYGPSGCGKSSLVKAGLLPRLSPAVQAIYVEATPEETEKRILTALNKALPGLRDDVSLVEAFAALRRGAGGKKVVLVIDQFEQWLHTHRAEPDAELIRALRQCDGGHVQALVMVRDDFAMAAARFMHSLDIPIVQGQNFATVDLFDLDHAEKVLIKFGQAFGRLPAQASQFSDDQRQFVSKVVAGLAEDGKVVSVRLSLFAEMVKAKPWTAATLEQVGGTAGVGVNFLEEMFSARTANPQHRLHQQAARLVLQALLPPVGVDIKGHMRSRDELLEASEYGGRPGEFDELVRILDGELRLMTPTDPAGNLIDSKVDPRSKYYQLTHDYLVPSLREWLTRKQRETRRGRAEIRLAEMTSLWTALPQNRHLPSLLEFVRFRWWTRRRDWTDAQRTMLAKARNALLRKGAVTVGLLALMLGGLAWLGRMQTTSDYIDLLASTDTPRMEDVVTTYESDYGWMIDYAEVRARYEQAADDSKQKLHFGMAIYNSDPDAADAALSDFLFARLLAADPDEMDVVIRCLSPNEKQLTPQLWKVAKTGSGDQRLRAAAALAQYDVENPDWKEIKDDVVTVLVLVPTVEERQWIEILKPAAAHLVDSLEARYRDRSPSRDIERPMIATALAEYLQADPSRLLKLLLLAESDREFEPLLQALKTHGKVATSSLQELLSQSPLVEGEARDAFIKQQANAAVALLQLGEGDAVWPCLRHSEHPTLRSFIIDRVARLGTEFATVADRSAEETDPAIQQALVQIMGEFDPGRLSKQQRASATQHLLKLYHSSDDPGIHSAAESTIGQWHPDDASELLRTREREAHD